MSQSWYANPTTAAVVQASIEAHTPTGLDGTEVSGPGECGMSSVDDDLDDFDPPEPDAADGGEADAEEGGSHYADVYQFVHEFLVHIYARRASRQNTRFRWCPQWYLHPEAIARLDPLWKAFQHLGQDPTTAPPPDGATTLGVDTGMAWTPVIRIGLTSALR